MRAFFEPGPPADTNPSLWRTFAQQSWSATRGATPGPVHCNLSFRDPLTGAADALPPAIESAVQPIPMADPEGSVEVVAARLRGRRGVIIAGRCESDPDDVLALAAALGWPVLSDHRSGCRRPQHDSVINHYDALLRDPQFAGSQRPDVVLRLGEIVSSKAVSLWLSSLDADIIASRPHGRHIDPEAIADLLVDELGLVASLAQTDLTQGEDTKWLTSWSDADRRVAALIDNLISSAEQPNEIAVARRALAAVPAGGALVLSSSMPVRDVEWFGGPRDDIAVYSNRGANGIDGVIATAVGVALTGVRTICLIGDVALLHDSSSLAALRDRPIDLTIVVTDNDGGAIFSFLPQHELLPAANYEFLFGTPHGTDLGALAAAHGLSVATWTADNEPDLEPAGVRIVIARTERAANLALHDQIVAAVGEGLQRP